MGEIIKQVLWDEPYYHFLAGYVDFTVIALLDFEEFPDNGMILFEELDILLNR